MSKSFCSTEIKPVREPIAADCRKKKQINNSLIFWQYELDKRPLFIQYFSISFQVKIKVLRRLLGVFKGLFFLSN